MARKSVFHLTPHERVILDLVQQGMNTTAIAKHLGRKSASVGCAINSAIKKHQLILVDATPKSHAPDSPHKAHGRKLDPFIK